MSDRPTWSESYRAECEARMVARMSKAQRMDYYALVVKYRGEPAARALAAMAKAEFEKMQNNAC